MTLPPTIPRAPQASSKSCAFNASESQPTGYRLRPELGDDIRSCVHGHYVIFFVAAQEDVTRSSVSSTVPEIPRSWRPTTGDSELELSDVT